MKNKHRLTNKDISEQYNGIVLHLMKCDLLSAFAYWITYQNENSDNSKLHIALNSYSKFLDTVFDKPDKVVEFTYEQLSQYVSPDVFESIPDVLELNKLPKIICLGALARNIFYMIVRLKVTQPL